jgi:hypothetical protein
MVSIFLTCQTYIVDAFPMYAASAVAATTCFRSIFGTFLVSSTPRFMNKTTHIGKPFAGPPLFQTLGLGWGNTVLGLIAIVLTPMIQLFLR